MDITISKNDEIVMKLLHYFITEQGYNPVILHGAKDEIWLENNDSDYKIVRIVSNYIHNDEQLQFDLFKTKQILKKIKRKMFSFKINALSIFVNLGDNVHLDDTSFDNIDLAKLNKLNDIKNYSFIINTFPNILEVETSKEEGMELFIKLTSDINNKNQEETKKAEEVFSKKKPIVTYSLIIINILIFLILVLLGGGILEIEPNLLYKFGALVNFDAMGRNPIELYRLFTSIFLHAGLFHLLCNMYSLYVIGPQLESFYGKTKFLIIYILSGIIGNLLSIIFLGDSYVSVGASGAIFGLLGSLLYFGYHYRIYLSSVIKSQIIPLILLNLLIGFAVSGINNFAHVGGLIGGILVSIAVGVKYKSTKFDIINGIIMTIIFVGFLSFMLVTR